MKSKIIFLLTAITMLASMAFGFTACGEEDAHTHVYDRTVKEEIYVKKAATCVSYAEYYYSCECGEKGTVTFFGDVYGSHKLTHIEKQPESCTESGMKEYWVCNGGCGLSFADEKCEQIISDSSSMVIPAAHKLTHHEEEAATCTKDGVKEYWSCSACKNNFAYSDALRPLADLVIPATHVGWENNKCTGCGYDAGGTEGLEYSLYYDTLTYAVSKGSVNSGNVEIPETYNGLPVSAIGSFEGSSITGISIPASVKTILGNAFCGCTALTGITVPDTVEQIYYQAFMDCTNLSDVKLSAGLKNLGNSLFQNCTSLKKITVPEGVESIYSATFRGCSALTEITLPHSLKSIDKFAFADCIALNNITLPDGLEKIDEVAFGDCRSLTEITIPESVITISKEAFYMCNGLTVYCEAAEKPEGWHEDWYSLGYGKYCEVVWGHKQNNS